MSQIFNDVARQLSDSFAAQADDNIGSFAIKALAMIVPAALLGHWIDQSVKRMQADSQFGTGALPYVAIQIGLAIAVTYALTRVMADYTKEMQNTLAGLFFVAIFFNMQGTLVANIQAVLGSMSLAAEQ